MSYIGENVAVADFSKQSFTGNSSTTVFTLSSSVANANCLMVSVGGIIQEPDVAYTASGTTLTFSSAPTTGNIVYVIYLAKDLTDATHANNKFNTADIPDGSIIDAKIATGLAASKLTGALPAISGAALTGILTDTSSLEDNIAMLGFKLASNNSLAKYNLVDRTIDEYQDATGIDASASTGEGTSGTGTGKYYSSIVTGANYHTTDSDTMFLLQSNSSANGHTTFTDTSGNGATLSAVGSMIHSTSEAKFGSSAFKFNGSSGIEIASGDISFPASNWTIEFWIKHPVGSAYGARVIGHWPSGNNNQFFIRPQTTNDGNGYGLVYAGWGGTSGQFTGSPMGSDLIQTNNWVHVAIVQEGSRLRQFINGVNQGDWALNSNCNSGNPAASPTDKWHIGTNNYPEPSGYNEFLRADVYMDDIRFSDVARYTGTTTFTPNESTVTGAAMSLVSTSTTASTAPTKGDITVLIEDNLGTATINTDIKGYVSRNGGTGWDQGTLVHEGTWGTNRKILSFHDKTFSNSASGTDMKYKIETANQSYTAGTAANVDSSSGGHTGTLQADATFSTTQKKFGTHSLYCDGTGDGLLLPNHADYNSIGTGNYTLELWCYPTATNASHDYMIGTTSWDASNNFSWFLGMTGDGASGTSRGFQWSQYNGSGGASNNPSLLTNSDGGSATFAINTWHHVAVVRSGNTTKLYVNGEDKGYSSLGTPLTGNPNLGGTGGVQIGGGHGYNWEGYIDEVRLSNTARYSSNFTPSATAFTSDANTKLLMHMEVGAASGKVTRVHATSLAWS